MVLAESTGSETVRYWHGLDTLAQSNGTTTEYFGYDGLGSVRQLVGESGSVGLAQTFDPYGNGFSKAGSASSSFGYSGEQTDSNGFVFLRARYYNPAFGRFFQRDGFRGNPNYPLTLNPYMFVLGNPILHTDFSGYCVDGITTFACVAVGIIVGTIIGGTMARVYAEWMYQWALTGECGCDKQTWALQLDKNRYMLLMTAVGAFLGGLAGGVAATGGLGLVIVGGFGLTMSSIQIIGAFIDAQHNQWNPCNVTDLALGIVGAILSVYAIAKGAPTAGDDFAALVNRGKAFFLSKEPLPPPVDTPEVPVGVDPPEAPPDAPEGIGSGAGASTSQPKAVAPVAKFRNYIFKPGATHGKDPVFRGLGYGPEDSELLAGIYEQQAWSKYQQGQYSFGKVDQFGQRIDIEIVLGGIGEAAGKRSYLVSGWMIQADGSITLNTPFSGFSR